MITISFTPDGIGRGFYTEEIDLTAVGPLTIERATSVEFNHAAQQWGSGISAVNFCTIILPARSASRGSNNTSTNRKEFS